MATLPEELVTTNAEVMGGRPVFAGTRVPIEFVLASLAAGIDMSRVRDSYPFLTEAHIRAALAYEEAHPHRDAPQSIAEAHPDWVLIESGVLRPPRNDLPPRLTDLTPELVACIVEGSVGRASDEDSTTLSGWCMYEARLAHTPDVVSRHLVGWAEEAHEGRTSSAVVELDVGARTARTESGRLYRLRGRPGPGGDARHVWNRFVRSNGATDTRDVTDEVFNLVAQLGMPVAADVEFEPLKARTDSPPVDLSDTLAQMPDVGRDEDFARSREADFVARGERAWQDYRQTGESRPAGAVFDQLQERVDARRQQWLAENKEALENSNEFVDKNGLPLSIPKTDGN